MKVRLYQVRVFEGDPEALRAEYSDEWEEVCRTLGRTPTDGEWLLDCFLANEDLLDLVDVEYEFDQ